MKLKPVLATITAVAVTAVAALLFVARGPLTGCQPPVSDEAVVTIEGRVLNQDGTPASGIYVRLVKSDLDVLDADWVVGHIVNTDTKPFRDVKTAEDGSFLFELQGADANAKNQAWAAYFVAYAVHPEHDAENDKRLAVATDSFSFSNQNLNKVIPDMRFWDLAPDAVTVDADKVTVTWENTDLEPEDGRYLVHFEGTQWLEEVKGNTFSLPLIALEPCEAPVVDSPETCTVKTKHMVEVVSLADGLRYRTAWHTFDATNPKGMGIWYRADDNTSGRTCSGKVVFDLNDGKFSGANAVYQKDAPTTAEEMRCFQFDLGKPYVLDDIFLQNGSLWFHKDARIEFFVSDKDAPQDADWAQIDQWEGKDNRFAHFNLRIPGNGETARWLKVELTDIGAKASLACLGELVVYGTAK
ncbi:MAG: hypothetical protein FJ109_02125 [Deltaproteobacteria bacterium]|nr:hypothetical protein [Deltaproteobacteria bacterium]